MILGCAATPVKSNTDRVNGLLSRTPLIDGHNDLLIHYLGPANSLGTVDQYDIRTRASGQVDIPRMRAGHVGAAVFTVGINDPNHREVSVAASTSLLRELARRSSNDFEVVTDAAGVTRAFQSRKIAALMGLEGGDQIGGSLEVLRVAYRHGVRAMTLTWDNSNDIADASTGAMKHRGLSVFGDSVVREMNRLGMLVDLSHSSDSTVFDALAISRAPIILSHSSARAIAPAPRNVSDTLLKLVAKNGGIVMVTFVPYFTTPQYWEWYQRGETHWASLMFKHKGDRVAVRKEFDAWDAANPPPVVQVADVANHIEHVRNVAGIDHVGIGADFDGMDFSRITGLEDVSKFPALFVELMKRGWTDADLEKLAGKNFLRVLKAVEAKAVR